MVDKNEKPQEEEPPAPPSQERQATLGGPAVAANKFYVILGASGVRVAFSERAAPDLDFHFRAAVLLSYPDATELKNLLARMLAPVEKQLAEQKQATASKDNV